jgi:hypothetical protein
VKTSSTKRIKKKKRRRRRKGEDRENAEFVSKMRLVHHESLSEKGRLKLSAREFRFAPFNLQRLFCVEEPRAERDGNIHLKCLHVLKRISRGAKEEKRTLVV